MQFGNKGHEGMVLVTMTTAVRQMACFRVDFGTLQPGDDSPIENSSLHLPQC